MRRVKVRYTVEHTHVSEHEAIVEIDEEELRRLGHNGQLYLEEAVIHGETVDDWETDSYSLEDAHVPRESIEPIED